jgi:hypothetical protein
MSEWYDTLHEEGLLSEESLQKINQHKKAPLFSVHWELKTLLYAGILMLTAGLGILVYENIDTIGHQFVLAFIALISIGSFAYCFKLKQPFDRKKVQSPNPIFNYTLLLGCISFVTFTGYLQYQYQAFGTNYGMATFVPMVVLFFVAYYFDHLGILSMAIANLALWMGVSVTPRELLTKYDFDNETIIYTYLILGVLLLVLGYASQKLDFKGHFKFSYHNYGVHVTFIILLAGYFHFYDSAAATLWMLGVFALAGFMYYDSYRNKSFYFLLLVILYSYFAISSLVARGLMHANGADGIYLMLLYFITSGAGLLILLMNLNKKIKSA